MIEADLAIVDASELVTVRGEAPRRGALQSDLGIIEHGCLAARDGLIVFVGDERDYRRQVRLARSGLEIDAGGRTVLPGFVDPHTHLPFAGSREREFSLRLRGARYEEIAAQGGGILATVEATRAAEEDDLRAAVKKTSAYVASLPATSNVLPIGGVIRPALRVLEAGRN